MPLLPEQRKSPAADRAPSNVISDGDDYRLPARIDQTLHDALLEALLAGERAWWKKRAQQFLDARPRPGDFRGLASDEDLRAQHRRLTDIARACRARAQVSPVDDIREDIANVLLADTPKRGDSE